MTTRLKRVLLIAAIPFALAGTALAGRKTGIGGEVSIDFTSKRADGTISAASNSADGAQTLGCHVTGWAGSPLYVACFAWDKNNKLAICDSEDPSVVAAALSVSNSSRITFAWDKSYHCTEVGVANESPTDPKAHP